MLTSDWFIKHRNLFLILLLVTTLAIGANASRDQLHSPTVEIPVMAVTSPTLSPLESYRQQRDQQTLTDIAALEKLIAQSTLDTDTKEDAAVRLQAMIAARQAQSALEGSLCGSSLAPCVAVLAGDALTIVTEKADINKKDTTLVLTLAAAHAGIRPENVRIITAE